MISSTTVRQTYAGNGSTTQFPYAFPIEEAIDINLWVTDSLGNITPIPSNFTVDTVNKWVNYPTTGSPLATGSTLTLVCAVPPTQSTHLTNSGLFDASVLETMSDRLTLIAQRLFDQTGRAVVMPDGYTGTFNPNIKIAPSASPPFPLPAAGLVLAVDPTGQYLGFFSAGQITSFAAAAGGMFQGTNIQAAINFLNPYISGTKGTPTQVLGSTAIALQSSVVKQTWVIKGNGGPVTGVSLNTSGMIVGQRLVLIGADNTNTVSIAQGAAGTALSGNLLLGATSSGSTSASCELEFDGTNWQEISRT